MLQSTLHTHTHKDLPHLYHQDTHSDSAKQVFVVIQPLLHLLVTTLKRDRHEKRVRTHADTQHDTHTHTLGIRKRSDGLHSLSLNVSVCLSHTHPCPECVGGIATTVLEDVLTAAVWHHLLQQGGVPVFVPRHSTTPPLTQK